MFFKIKKSSQLISMTVIILILMVVLISCRLRSFAFILVVLYIIYLTLNILSKLNEVTILTSRVEDISKAIEVAIKDNVGNFIYPACVINKAGEIKWANEKFNEEFGGPKGSSRKNILTVLKDLNLERLIKGQRNVAEKIKTKKSFYEVYGKKVYEQKEETYILISFNEIAQIHTGAKQSIVLIQVDNIEEAIAPIEQENRPIFLAEIERSINKYAESLGAMIEKYDDDKYILSVLDFVIEKEISRKFDILDKFKEIEFSNKVAVTLSIGIGRDGATPQENQINASKAIELALGRGGDQVVVKANKDFKIFGGNTREKEKRTRVKARVIAHALKDLIYESENIFILGHKKTDMDCFGAALGLAATIKYLGKPCKIVLDDNTKTVDNFIEDLKEFQDYNDIIINFKDAKRYISNKSLIIIVDVHNEGYISNFEFLSNCDRVVIIDHHRISTDYIKGALLNYIEVYASSTSELITEMIQYMVEKPVLKRIEAEALLAGICLDTKNFTFKTGVRTFEAAAFLRKLGADTVEVKKIFDNDISSYLIKAEVIKSAKIKDGIAIAKCPEIIQDTALAAQGADELLNITGIICSFVFVKVGNEVYLSSRSLGEINVQVIMEALGGGGHRTMAGTKFVGISMDEAIEKLEETLKEYLKEGE
ncbi:MAG: DHH family phosphoesterase [Sarcina sp.]